ncbi:uncharacterized protein [Magallana gigas]|uniref:uncharacterized protein isoform X2 n=1 Tax=Magallana gigas TaxID=29159 RepID=UPI0033408CFE
MADKPAPMEYIMEVLKRYENDKNYIQAFQEYKDLMAAKAQLSSNGHGIPSFGPVVPFKEENVTEEQRTYKPNLAQILLDACMHLEKNSTLAWREYIDCIEKHKIARPRFSTQKKDYMREVLKRFENDKNYAQAFQEYKDLTAAKDQLSSNVHGIPSLGPVVPFKEENVTEEQRTYKPNLAQILLDACMHLEKNSTLAWREYIDCIEKHKIAPTPSAGNPKMSIKTSTGNIKYYMREVLREYENDKNYEQAFEECKDLLAAKGQLATSVYGISNPGPVVPFKEEKVTEEQRTYKPNLAQILLDACMNRAKNSTLAWREYIDCIEIHKIANSADRSREFIAAQAPVDPIIDQLPTEFSPEIHAEAANTTEAYEYPTKKNKEQKQTLTLFELLDKEDNKDSDEFEEAQQDLVHMFTCQAVLRSSFPHANLLQHVIVNIDKAEDVPENVRDRRLYRYLKNLKPETFDGHYSDIWREYGTLLMAENLLDLAKIAKGPDQNLYVVVRKTQFYEMQSELQLKTQEVEELSTRLSKFASQQLTEGNPNIADLSDTHRPTRLGEMYSQLFDDEWSEAFEAFKPKTEDDGDDALPDTLYTLQNILTNIFEFCKDQFKRQKIYLEDSFAVTLGFEKPKRDDAASEKAIIQRSKVNSEEIPSLEKKEQTVSFGDSSTTEKRNKEEDEEEHNRETDGGNGSSEQLLTPPIAKENPNKLEADNEEEQKYDQIMTTQEHGDENGQQILPLDKDLSTDNEINAKKNNQEPSYQKPKQETLEDGNRSERKQEEKVEPGDVKPEDRVYRNSVEYPNLVRHAKNFSKAVASTTAKSKSKLFIDTELPALIEDEIIRADVRVVTYVRKCVELCWYMCMQDPPMVIISPKQGQLVDKALFSFHGRRGKIVEVCVWPALLLHDNGPLVCKGYVLPEERNRNR